ncbi:MAG: hypothetical protein ABW208_12550 [Pyrinomonadaceae bacterium]
MKFPINEDTFKKSFLEGNGNFEVTTPQNSWEALVTGDQRFPDDAETVAKLSLGVGSKFKFGEPSASNKGLKLNADVSASANSEIRLIRSKTDPLIKSYELQEHFGADTLYAAVLLGAAAAGKLDGSLPAGPLKTTFGIGAGASVAYERLVPFKKSDSARKILADLFTESRLPQAVNSPGEVPAEGEVLALRYEGYLDLSAGATWGYSFSGTKSVDVLDFGLALKYSLKLAASASFKYRLAGSFTSEARRAKGSDWARFVVRKSRETTTEFAADIGLQAEANLEGLPESPDKLLAALLGTNAEAIFDKLALIEENASLDKLEQNLGKLVSGFVLKRADKWIEKALDNNTVAEFLKRAHEIIDAYEKLDERIIGLYEDFLDGKLSQLSALLDRILALPNREALQGVTAGEVWDLIRRLSKDRFNDLLLVDAEFKRFIALVKKAKEFVDGGKDKLDGLVRDLIAEAKKEFPLDGLFTELAKYDEAAELKQLADEKIQGLVSLLIGKAFDELKGNDDFKKAAEKVKAAVDQIATFRAAYADTLKKAVHQSFAANVAFNYKSARKGEALLDVEINLSHPEGPGLALLASRGNFIGVLDRYQPGAVRINRNKFTEDLTRSTEVQVTIWNWKYRHLAEVIQHSEHSVEAAPAGGLLHVYSIDTSGKETTEKQGWDKFKESVKTNFTLSIMGQTFQPQGTPSAGPDGEFLVETLSKMAANYDLSYEDERTRPVELTQYLALADHLKLGPGSAVTVSELTTQFPVPPGLGKVSVNYAVRYNDAAVRAAFLQYDVNDKNQQRQLEDYTRDTARLLISAYLTGKDNNNDPPLGFAYTSTSVYQTYRKIGNREPFMLEPLTIIFPAWHLRQGQSQPLTKQQKDSLFTYYKQEDEMVNVVTELFRVIGESRAQNAAIPEKDLKSASENFLKISAVLNARGGPTTFFAVFDKLVQKAAAAAPDAERKSTMIVEITPPNAKPLPSGKEGEKEKVVKFFPG